MSASAPASSAAAGDLGEVGHVGAELGPAGQLRAALPDRGDHLRGGLGRVGEHPAAVLEVRAAHVDLERRRDRRRPAIADSRRGELLDGAAPDAHHRPRPGRDQAGKVVAEPRFDPGALQADAVEHPGRRPGAPAARGLPGHGLDRQRLDHHRAEARREGSTSASSSAWPAVPDAVITGFGNRSEPTSTARSTPPRGRGPRARRRRAGHLRW